MFASSRVITGGAVVMLSLGVLLFAGGLSPVVVGAPIAQQPAPAPSASAAGLRLLQHLCRFRHSPRSSQA
jgi:hypothetical protein